MEIVVVSDTVRQRRSRTPLSSTSTTTSTGSATIESGNVMPDLLPKTFHLVESNPLFLQINSPNGLSIEQPTPVRNDHEEKVSVVEIRESNILMPKKAINTFNSPQVGICENVSEILNTCSILESVNYLEPSDAEMVHIVDGTSEPSDSDTCCSTPNLDDRPQSRVINTGDSGSGSGSDSESEEYETGEPATGLSISSCIVGNKLTVRKKRISFDESKELMRKDRDLLKDSEEKKNQRKIPTKPQRRRLRPTLKEILTTDRDSFDGAEKDGFEDEPLIFSDDEGDNDVIDHGMHADEQIIDRDTVLIQSKQKPRKIKSI